MKKKLSFIVIIIVILVAGVYFWQKSGSSPQTQEDALKQARQYKPEGECTLLITLAIHKATGVKYTFNSGCIPPGWEK